MHDDAGEIQIHGSGYSEAINGFDYKSFFFSKPNLEKIWIDVFKRNHSFTLFQRNMYKYKNKGSLVKNSQLIIDYRQESSEATPQTLIINALRF